MRGYSLARTVIGAASGRGAALREWGCARADALSGQAHALLEASDLVAHVLHVGANHAGRDALDVIV